MSKIRAAIDGTRRSKVSEASLLFISLVCPQNAFDRIVKVGGGVRLERIKAAVVRVLILLPTFSGRNPGMLWGKANGQFPTKILLKAQH